jgi:hypothetical protein
MVLTNDGVKNQEMIEECAQVLNKAKRVVIFSGAGMSAESGIGTFRGGSGLWTGILGKAVLGWFGTPVGWKWTPQFAWSKYVDKFYNEIRDAKPNAGHYAITELSTIFPNTKIVTQNVDGLHQDVRAFKSSHNIFFRLVLILIVYLKFMEQYENTDASQTDILMQTCPKFYQLHHQNVKKKDVTRTCFISC